MGSALYNIVVTPLEYFIETVFSIANRLFQNPGVAIIFVSIAVQILVFPLYKKADDIQEEERQKQKSMEHWVNHIKKTFKGDERFMMQQAYYREMNYKPLYAIKGSISLLLQIPFFIAAYHYLSHLSLLEGVSFLGISDLSKPDGIIHIGAIAINLLPVLMTLFNIISGIIYTRGLPAKDKIQTYGLAILFLVILYKSPAGLVFYWTLNNLFSLLKNVLLKLIKNPKRAISITLIIIAISSLLSAVIIHRPIRTRAVFAIFGIMCLAIAILLLVSIKALNNWKKKEVNLKAVNLVFYFSICALFLLVALVIPTDIVKLSPMEFMSNIGSPAKLIFDVSCVYIGFIFVWLNIFYVFSSPKIRSVFAAVSSVVASVCLVDYLFFSKSLGNMSPYFIFDKIPVFSKKDILINIAAILLATIVVLAFYIKKSDLLKRAYQVICLTLSVVIVLSSVSIGKVVKSESQSNQTSPLSLEGDDSKIIPLSKNGKNVIVFMLDRAISGYLPYIMEDHPEIKEALAGFIYYPNTMSFGNSTNYGTPALFGGYEYTPTEMNKRSSEPLVKKHNEALTVLPKLFSDNGYKVTVIDPPYAGYKWIPDISIYDKYSGIDAYVLNNAININKYLNNGDNFYALQHRSAVFYSVARSAPISAFNLVYQRGDYWSTNNNAASDKASVEEFLHQYVILNSLSNMTEITDDSSNTFLMLQNSTTHEPEYLDESNNYMSINNEQPTPRPAKKLSSGQTMTMDNEWQIKHYIVNVAALLRVCEWINYLKENNVYDNTRIILVSDHGQYLDQFDYMRFKNGIRVEFFNPLLLVKDFNSNSFSVSNEFMTNADTPTLAVKDIIKNPVNPFTGKEINNDEKTAHPQYLTTSSNPNIFINNGNTFDTSNGEWYGITDNIFDEKNWKKAEVDK